VLASGFLVLSSRWQGWPFLWHIRERKDYSPWWSVALRDTLIRSMAVLNPNPYVICSHNARERCEESCGVFLHGRYSGGNRRTGPLNPKYPTCFIKEWRHKSITLICYQFRTAAVTRNYLRGVYSSTGQCWLVLNGKYVRIFRNVVDERQRVPILSWGQRIWSCNFHRSDFEWSYWTSEVAERGRVFAVSLSPMTRVSIFEVIHYWFTHSRPPEIFAQETRKCVSLQVVLRKQDHLID